MKINSEGLVFIPIKCHKKCLWNVAVAIRGSQPFSAQASAGISLDGSGFAGTWSPLEGNNKVFPPLNASGFAFPPVNEPWEG